MSGDGKLDHVQLALVDSMDKLDDFRRWLGERREVLGVDTETGGFSPERDRLRLVQFGDLNQGWAIPWERWGGVAAEVLSRYTEPLVLHNSKFDARFLTYHSAIGTWPWHRTHDTMTMAHLDDPLRSKALKTLAAKLVDPMAAAMQRTLDDGMKANKWTWDTVPLDFNAYWIYAALDPVLTCHIYEAKKHVLTQYREPYEIEMNATSVCYDMERFGARIDPAYCHTKGAELDAYANNVQAWLTEHYGIRNANSAKQLVEFFESINYPLPNIKTKGGAQSVGKEVLDLIDHPVAEQILLMRKARKIVDSYLSTFVEMVDPNGRLHPSINTMGTRTARMSVTDPALQTLPRKDPTVRDAFIPSDGNVLITCDYDQIEARLTAHFSQDQGLIDAFLAADADPNEDFFCTIASSIFHDQISKKDPRRQLTKNVVYGKIYGAGADTMARTAKIPLHEMEPVVWNFDSRFPGVKQLQQQINAMAQRRLVEESVGYINTPTGRKMVADDYKEYTLTNYLIQCHASEILKRKLGELAAQLDPGMMLLPVHDEVIFDVPKEDAADLKHLIETTMRSDDYLVPITASADVLTKSWGEKYHV